MIRAAIFYNEIPKVIVTGPIRQINAQIADGGTWREIGDDIEDIADVPALSLLPPHSELIAVDPTGGVDLVVDEITLENLIKALVEQVDAERDQRLYSPLTFASVTLDGDNASQQRLIAAATRAAINGLDGLPFSTGWITTDNSVVLLDSLMFAGFAQAIQDRMALEFLAGREAKDAIKASLSITAAQDLFDIYIASGI